MQNTRIAFPPSVPFTFFLLGAFVALRIFGFCNTSRARMLFLRRSAANVLLALRFFTSGMHSGLIEHVPSNSNGKPCMILILFSRSRFYNAMSLPPKPEQPFFYSRRLCWHENELPALEVSRKSILSFPPSLPFTFFVVPAFVAVHNLDFFNDSEDADEGIEPRGAGTVTKPFFIQSLTNPCLGATK